MNELTERLRETVGQAHAKGSAVISLELAMFALVIRGAALFHPGAGYIVAGLAVFAVSRALKDGR